MMDELTDEGAYVKSCNLMDDVDRLLLQLLVNYGEESLVITATKHSVHLSGSLKGKQFLTDNPDFAEKFQQYCFERPCLDKLSSQSGDGKKSHSIDESLPTEEDTQLCEVKIEDDIAVDDEFNYSNTDCAKQEVQSRLGLSDPNYEETDCKFTRSGRKVKRSLKVILGIPPCKRKRKTEVSRQRGQKSDKQQEDHNKISQKNVEEHENTARQRLVNQSQYDEQRNKTEPKNLKQKHPQKRYTNHKAVLTQSSNQDNNVNEKPPTKAYNIKSTADISQKKNLITCEICHLLFRDTKMIQNHHRLKHPELVNVNWDECNTTLQFHNKNGEIVCAICYLQFYNQAMIENHRRLRHPEFVHKDEMDKQHQFISEVQEGSETQGPDADPTNLFNETEDTLLSNGEMNQERNDTDKSKTKQITFKQRNSVKENKISCEVCSLLFEDQAMLVNHKQLRHPELRMNLNSDTPMESEKYHHNENSSQGKAKSKNMEMVCELCNLRFSNQAMMTNHRLLRHPEYVDEEEKDMQQDNPIMENCQTIKSIQRTFMTKQRENRKFCSICNLQFNEDIVEHHACQGHPLNEKESYSNRNYSHLQKTLKNGDIVCKVCNLRFRDQNMIENHRKLKHPQVVSKAIETLVRNLPRKFTCPTCNLIFHSQEMVENHFEIRHPDVLQKIIDEGSDVLTFLRQQNPCTSTVVGKQASDLSKSVNGTEGNSRDEEEDIDGGSELKNRRLGCKACPSHFTQRSDLHQHVLSFHPDKKVDDIIIMDYEKDLIESGKGEATKSVDKKHVQRRELSYGDTAPISEDENSICNEVTGVNDIDIHSVSQESSSSLVPLNEDKAGDEKTGIATQKKTSVDDSSFISMSNTKINTVIDLRTFRYFDFVRGSELKCYSCNEVFTSIELLYDHMISSDHWGSKEDLEKDKRRILVIKRINDKSIYKCSICKKEYTIKENSYKHIKQDICHKKSFKKCQMRNCNLTFDNNNFFMNHMITFHNQEYPFPCMKCSKTFLSLSEFDRHQAYHADKSKVTNTLIDKISYKVIDFVKGSEFKCYTCNEIFKSIELLYEHMNIENHKGFAKDTQENREKERKILVIKKDDGKPLYKCNICKREYSIKEHCRKHVQNDTCSNQYWRCCPMTDCRLSFESYNFFMNHMITFHNQEYPFPCSKCPKTFTYLRDLECHKGFHTRKENEEEMSLTTDVLLRCKCCRKGFHNNIELQKHMQDVHEAVKDKICDICGKRFRKNKGLNLHKISHEKKQFECHICGKMLTTKNSLRMHISAIHSDDKPFVCDVCGYQAKQMSTLRYHINRAHRTAKPYVCSYENCCSAYKDYQLWQSHMQRHALKEGDVEKAKSYGRLKQCDICQEYLTVRVRMDTHMIKHSTEKSLTCDLCGKSIKRMGSFKRHLKNVHGKYFSITNKDLYIRKVKQTSSTAKPVKGDQEYQFHSEAAKQFMEFLSENQESESVTNTTASPEKERDFLTEAHSQISILENFDKSEILIGEPTHEVTIETNQDQVIFLNPADTLQNMENLSNSIVCAVKNDDGTITLHLKKD